MSERKPFAVPFTSWIDQQIASAQRRGDFDNLAGAGKPLPQRDTSDPAWWVKQKLASENLEMPLPASLQVRKEVARTLAAIAMLDDESRVREALTLLNQRIRKANATSIDGPPTNLAPIPIDAWIDQWKAKREQGERHRA